MNHRFGPSLLVAGAGRKRLYREKKMRHLSFLFIVLAISCLPCQGAEWTRYGKRTTAVVSVAAVQEIVTNYLRDNVNDPSKFSIVEIRRPLSTRSAYKWQGNWTVRDAKSVGMIGKTLWEPINRDGYAVRVKYRSTNAFGVLVLRTSVFCISGGKVFDVVRPDDIRPRSQVTHEDPAFREFMDMANKQKSW